MSRGDHPQIPKARPTIYDVAAVAGVSHQTVSRVVNGRANIRESTRQRVLAALEQMNYKPNATARALATNRTKRIGVVVDSAVQYGPMSTMRGIQSAARMTGYAVLAATVDDSRGEGIVDALDHLKFQGVDALCVVAPRYSTLAGLRAAVGNLPTLVVKAEGEEGFLSVGVDQYAGAARATEHLISLGHRRIVHLAGPPDWVDARVRAKAFEDSVMAAGLELLPTITGDWTSDFGYEVGLQGRIEDVSAVFAANDQMALGLVHGLSDRGMFVPRDVSVVGFDDTADTKHFSPPLTTIRQDFEALGRLSVDVLIKALDGQPLPSQRLITPQLVVRNSTRGLSIG